MSWLGSLFNRRALTSTKVGAVTLGPAQLEGLVEAITELHDPLTGDAAVALHYRGSAPGAMSRAYAQLWPALDVRMEARQAVDFLLRDDSGAALIRVDPGDDVAALHASLLAAHGMELRSECEALLGATRVIVQGEVVELHRTSPHRGLAYDAIVEATSILPS